MPVRGASVLVAVSVAAAVCVTHVAAAQVLHERVDVARATLRCADGVCRGADRAGRPGQLRAIEQDGEILYAPDGEAPPKPGEQVFSPQPEAAVEAGGSSPAAPPGDAPPERRDLLRTDRETGPEPPGTRTYHVVFDPDPYPYKRMTVLDDVRILPCQPARAGCDDEVLVVHDPERTPLPVAGPVRTAGRDAFWGSIVIDLEPGGWVPIPSVAADTEVLEARTSPVAPLSFARDGADNVYVRSTVGGRHRLTWLSDAPQRYFAGELPDGVRLGDVPRALKRPLPERLRPRVQRVLARIGLGKASRSTSYGEALDALVGYFRAFELGELPAPEAGSGSSYLDIALGQRGVCRHRAYAFTITALGLGLPARYVENEVHVFVEVWVPQLGWRRINLGGAPLDEELVGGSGKRAYQEKGGDPFPQPEAFRKTAAPPPKGLAELKRPPGGGSDGNGSGGNGGGSGGNGNGGSGGNGNGASSGNGNGASSGNGNGASSGNGNGSGSGSSGASGSGYASDGPASSGGRALVDLEALARADERSHGHRAATHVTVELAAPAGYRGETVAVRGTVRVDGGDPAGLPIEVYLVPAGGALAPAGAYPLAAATTDGSGRWEARFELPRDLPLGDHRVVARTRGDDRRAPSTSSR